MALKILLADDSMIAQNMGKKILTDAGYEVTAVSNGAAAVKRLPEVNPDIVLLDIYMPGYTGLEVCERMKKTPATARVPVLLTVGKLEPFRPEDGRKAGAAGVIVKPFEATDLITVVAKLAELVPAEVIPPTLPPPLATVEAEVPPQHANTGHLEDPIDAPAPARVQPQVPPEIAATAAFAEDFLSESAAVAAEAPVDSLLPPTPSPVASGENQFPGKPDVDLQHFAQPPAPAVPVLPAQVQAAVAGLDVIHAAEAIPAGPVRSPETSDLPPFEVQFETAPIEPVTTVDGLEPTTLQAQPEIYVTPDPALMQTEDAPPVEIAPEPMIESHQFTTGAPVAEPPEIVIFTEPMAPPEPAPLGQTSLPDDIGRALESVFAGIDQAPANAIEVKMPAASLDPPISPFAPAEASPAEVSESEPADAEGPPLEIRLEMFPDSAVEIVNTAEAVAAADPAVATEESSIPDSATTDTAELTAEAVAVDDELPEIVLEPAVENETAEEPVAVERQEPAAECVSNGVPDTSAFGVLGRKEIPAPFVESADNPVALPDEDAAPVIELEVLIDAPEEELPLPQSPAGALPESAAPEIATPVVVLEAAPVSSSTPEPEVSETSASISTTSEKLLASALCPEIQAAVVASAMAQTTTPVASAKADSENVILDTDGEIAEEIVDRVLRRIRPELIQEVKRLLES